MILLDRFKKSKNKIFMEAIAAGSAMVAFADGLVRPEEVAKLLDYVRIEESLKVFDSIEIIETFEKFIESFEFDFRLGKEKAFKAIQKIEKRSEEARILILVCCAIGSSDDYFDNNQIFVIREMCKTLGLNPKQFNLDLRAPSPEDLPKITKASSKANIPEWMRNPPQAAKQPEKKENIPEWMKKTPEIINAPKKQENIPEWMRNPPKLPKQTEKKENIPEWMKKKSALKKHNKKDDIPEWMKKK